MNATELVHACSVEVVSLELATRNPDLLGLGVRLSRSPQSALTPFKITLSEEGASLHVSVVELRPGIGNSSTHNASMAQF